jgi:peroxisome-assembly ATPase
MLSETFSEVHQDLTSPFRPNVSGYAPRHLAEDALEDDPLNRIRRIVLSDMSEQERMEALGQTPNFSHTGSFTGEDERFAYKRATSRLWEMCGARWWARNDEGWWKPHQHRQWEVSTASVSERAISQGLVHDEPSQVATGKGRESRGAHETGDEPVSSPFRCIPRLHRRLRKSTRGV